MEVQKGGTHSGGSASMLVHSKWVVITDIGHFRMGKILHRHYLGYSWGQVVVHDPRLSA